MSSVIRDIQTRKKKRRMQRWYRNGIFAALGCLALMGVFFVPQLKITSVSVSGLHVVNAQNIEDIARTYLGGRVLFVYPRNNFFLAPTDEIARAIKEQYPRVVEANVLRSFPRGLDITARERQVVGVWCIMDAGVAEESFVSEESALDTLEAKNCFYLDESGIIFETAPEFSGNLIMKIRSHRDSNALLGASVVAPQTIRDMQLASERVQQLFGTGVQSFTIGQGYKKDIVAITENGWYVHLEEGIDIKASLDSLKLVLEREVPDLERLEYADARFPGKIFYKLRDK